MIVGIHQPHFWPWLGYFDKMAKSDVFVILDTVQMEKGSYMYRNRVQNTNGEPFFLTISADKHGYLDKPFSDIKTIDNKTWINKHLNEIKRIYGKSSFFNEVFPLVNELYNQVFDTVCEYDCYSIEIIKNILNINTKIIKQSELSLNDTNKKNDLILSICKELKASIYLSGNGARKYNEEEKFAKENIQLIYQTFKHPEYKQRYSEQFIPGLSILDVFFCCGIEYTKNLFNAD